MPRQLRIVHIINNLILGGAENLMSTLLPALKQRGESIYLICLNDGAYAPYRQVIEEAGIPIIVLHQGSVYNPFLIAKLAKALQEIKPDVVHAHLFPSTYWTSLACWLYGLSTHCVMTEHDTSNRRMKNALLRWPEYIAYKGFDGVICISEAVEEAVNKHMPFVSTQTIHNGIPLAGYMNVNPPPPSAEVVQQLNAFTQQRQVLLSVGRLAIKKNHETLIRMMRFLPTDVCLIICGEGDRRPILEQLIRDEKVGDRVWLAGAQQHISYFIHQAKLGLLSSTIEGFGLAAVEMMAGGLPVLCSNVPGLKDVCADTYLLLDPHDAQGYAERVQSLLHNKELYLRMQALCLACVPQYSIEHMADAYHQYYLNQCPL